MLFLVQSLGCPNRRRRQVDGARVKERDREREIDGGRGTEREREIEREERRKGKLEKVTCVGVLTL